LKSVDPAIDQHVLWNHHQPVFFDDERHKLPHIHAKYKGLNASLSILDGTLLVGNFPVGKERLVQAWIEFHRDALMADTELAVNGQPLLPIEPLR